MTRRTSGRWASVVVLAMLLLASCARSNTAAPIATGGKYGSGVDLKGLDDAKNVHGGVDARSNPGAGTSSGGGLGPLPTTPAGKAPSGGSASLVSRDTGPLGANAAIYLRRDFSTLVIEINAAEGTKPQPSALSLLKTRLEEVVDKPGGIQIITKSFPASNTKYSWQEVQVLESRYRKQHSDPRGPKAVIHMLYLNGQMSDNPNRLGVAYGASSIVMLPDRMKEAANPLLTAEEIEQAALVHETGHILSLVNIGYQSPRNHEDQEHKGHSSNKNSVMYWAVEVIDVATLLNGTVPTAFDVDDKADLADIRAGKITVFPY